MPTVVDGAGFACCGAAPPTVGAELDVAGAAVAAGAALLFTLALALLVLFVLLE